MSTLLDGLGITVLQRGWLSSNNVVFRRGRGTAAAVVDTGHAAHSAQTRRLVAHALADQPLGLIVNTHLHSDHCGGNAMLQDTWPEARTLVPRPSLAAVREWDEVQLTYRALDQQCVRFAGDGAVGAGDTVMLFDRPWDVLAAPGHDPLAMMLFEPDSRVLIAGDALWEERLAIIFPELVGEPGFAATAATLDTIERLDPRVVIPGHGPPFTDVSAAIDASRARLAAFRSQPTRHDRYAGRALAAFRVMEQGGCAPSELATAMNHVPMLRQVVARSAVGNPGGWGQALVDDLLQSGVLRLDEAGRVVMPHG